MCIPTARIYVTSFVSCETLTKPTPRLATCLQLHLKYNNKNQNTVEGALNTYESSIKNVTFGGTSSGWIGDKSVATICDCGNASPIWIAHSPVPVAISRTNRGGFDSERGAKNSLSPYIREIAAYCKLRRSCSGASLGKKYANNTMVSFL